MKRLRKIICTVVCGLSVLGFAATPNPTTMLNNMTNQLLSALKQNRAKLQSQPTFVYSLVDKILLPHVDKITMAQSVLGRQGWTKATPAERKAFTNEFTNTVIRTYASALNAYTDETVKYFPIRGGYEGKQFVQVNSQIVRPDGPPVPITYSMILNGNEWKVFDMNVEGISLLQSFRSQFSAQLSQGMSVSQIISNLKAHNQKIGVKKS